MLAHFVYELSTAISFSVGPLPSHPDHDIHAHRGFLRVGYLSARETECFPSEKAPIMSG